MYLKIFMKSKDVIILIVEFLDLCYIFSSNKIIIA